MLLRAVFLLSAPLTATPEAPAHAGGSAPGRCSIRYADGSSWRPTADHARFAAREADAVVRARAAGTDSLQFRPGDRHHPVVVLEVLEVIGGDSVPPSLKVYGWLTDADDFNRAPVPYPAVRPAGQRGSCFAEEYRRGGEFLLLLTWRAGQLTPYWAALAPTNEQIRGRADPWVSWVRAERRRAGRQ